MKKTLSSLRNLSRLAPASHWRALGAYSSSNVLAWVKNVGAYWLRPKHPFVSGDQRLSMDNSTTISIAGDWASGTQEAAEVAARIVELAPDYTIHLGDTYYVGNAAEQDENFLGVKQSPYDPVSWPRGRKGTYALLGNHDMYSNGDGYFNVLLPAIGQSASYFCLENDHWRIVALDTGYNSTGLDLWPLRPSCKLRAEQIAWIAALNLKQDHKGLIFLSHHQPWSSFERGYPKPYQQLAPFLPRDRFSFWFWGHEHRLAIYDDHYGIYGRCVGHGGMPVELRQPNNVNGVFCRFTDEREYPNGERLKVGYNGFAHLMLEGERVHVEYRDLAGKIVFTEMLGVWGKSA